MRIEQNNPSPRFGSRRKLCNRHAIVHNPYVGSMQSVLDSSMDSKPPPSTPTLASMLSQSSHMFRLGTTPNYEGSGGEWAGRTITAPSVGGWSGGVAQDQFLPRSTKRNAYVGILRHAPATTNGLKDIWDDNPPNSRHNRSGPLLSQVDLGNRMNSRRLKPADLSDLPLIEFTIPEPSNDYPAQTESTSPSNASSIPSNSSSASSLPSPPSMEKKRNPICPCDRCVICLASFQTNDQLRALPCHHAFHRKCIDRWLLNTRDDSREHTNFCPTCRTVIIPKPPPVISTKQPSQSTGGAEDGEEGNGIPAWSFAMLGAKLYSLDTKN